MSLRRVEDNTVNLQSSVSHKSVNRSFSETVSSIAMFFLISYVYPMLSVAQDKQIEYKKNPQICDTTD